MEEQTRREIIIRPISLADIPPLNAIRSNPCVARSILSVTTETAEQTAAYFFEQNNLKYGFAAQVGSGENAAVAGYIRLLLDSDQRKRHIGKISVSVSPEFQNLGVGGRLLDAAIDLAKSWFGLKKLALTVLSCNEQAVYLYKSRGFEIEGLLRMDIIVDGIPSDVYTMGKYLVPLPGTSKGEDFACPSAI